MYYGDSAPDGVPASGGESCPHAKLKRTGLLLGRALGRRDTGLSSHGLESRTAQNCKICLSSGGEPVGKHVPAIAWSDSNWQTGWLACPSAALAKEGTIFFRRRRLPASGGDHPLAEILGEENFL